VTWRIRERKIIDGESKIVTYARGGILAGSADDQ